MTETEREREQEVLQALCVISFRFKRCYYLTVFLLGPDVQDRVIKWSE